MKNLLFSLLLIGLLGCVPDDGPTDAAARASGRYAVQLYVAFGDTLYVRDRINTLNLNDFDVYVSRVSADSISVGIHVSYNDTNGPGGSFTQLKGARLQENSGKIQLLRNVKTSADYESSVEGNTFYERTSSNGFVPDRLVVWSFPRNPPTQAISITARK